MWRSAEHCSDGFGLWQNAEGCSGGFPALDKMKKVARAVFGLRQNADGFRLGAKYRRLHGEGYDGIPIVARAIFKRSAIRQTLPGRNSALHIDLKEL